jgi:hypothetical protein
VTDGYDATDARLGHVIPEIYDGISVWQHPDGRLENRWNPEHYPWRWRKTQEWIDAVELGRRQAQGEEPDGR